MKDLIREYGKAVLAAVIVALCIRFLVIEAYRIPSQAMRPTLETGDTLFVAKWSFGIRIPGAEAPITTGRMPARGEVVVFSSPEDNGRDYIKRVVGLPGDTVAIKNGHVVLNGKDLTTVQTGTCGSEQMPDAKTGYAVCWEPPVFEDFGPEQVPEGKVFMLGDFRSGTLKKKGGWGLTPLNQLKGKALWIWLSIEPAADNPTSGWFSRIRFERMFRGVG